MKAARIALGGVLVVTGLLAGCATPTNSAGGTGSPAATQPSASDLPSASVAALPSVSLTRSGGFAGVNQTIVISADGTWTYTDKRSNATSSGQFTPAQLVQFAQLALDPRLAQEALQTASGPVCNDAFQYTLAVGSQSASFEDCGQSRPAVKAVLSFVADNTAF
jgi:hypothetical protein